MECAKLLELMYPPNSADFAWSTIIIKVLAAVITICDDTTPLAS